MCVCVCAHHGHHRTNFQQLHLLRPQRFIWFHFRRHRDRSGRCTRHPVRTYTRRRVGSGTQPVHGQQQMRFVINFCLQFQIVSKEHMGDIIFATVPTVQTKTTKHQMSETVGQRCHCKGTLGFRCFARGTYFVGSQPFENQAVVFD